MNVTDFMGVMSVFVVGISIGYLARIVQEQFASEAQAKRRADRRRLLGLEDRPSRRPNAVGTARIHTANMKRRPPLS